MLVFCTVIIRNVLNTLSGKYFAYLLLKTTWNYFRRQMSVIALLGGPTARKAAEQTGIGADFWLIQILISTILSQPVVLCKGSISERALFYSRRTALCLKWKLTSTESPEVPYPRSQCPWQRWALQAERKLRSHGAPVPPAHPCDGRFRGIRSSTWILTT